MVLVFWVVETGENAFTAAATDPDHPTMIPPIFAQVVPSKRCNCIWLIAA